VRARVDVLIASLNTNRERNKVKRLRLIATLSILLVGLSASAAVADETTTINFANAPQGTHFVTGTPTPTCTVDPETLSVTCPTDAFELAGIGNTNAEATLTVVYSATILCNNPADGRNVNNPIEVQNVVRFDFHE
jgi:hypothetical protein